MAVPEFFKADRNAAIYLVGQGPFREPVPIEIQHQQIRRYIGMLHSDGARSIRYNDPDDIFIDLNTRRESVYDVESQIKLFPAFFRLYVAIADEKRYDVVFLNVLWEREFYKEYYSWMELHLERLGVRV